MALPPRLLATALGLVLALAALSAPIAPAAAGLAPAAASTTVSGFPKATKRVVATQKVYFKVKVNDRTSARRPVRMQKKVSGKWQTQVQRRTNPAGTVRFKWRAPKDAGNTWLRIVVPKSGRSSGTTTGPRKVTTITKAAGKLSKVDRYEARVFDLLNTARGRARSCGGKRYPAVGRLTRNAKLDRAARKYAQKMADARFFDHVAPDGSTPTSRARAEGYRRGVGENIAAGYVTPVVVMTAWLASPGHCANVMSPAYQDVGLGFALPRPGRSAIFSDYWVQDFG